MVEFYKMEMTMENLIDVLTDYFGMNNQDGTYTYELTRVKSAFAIGTMSMDDFVEWGEDEVNDLAECLWNKFSNKKIKRGDRVGEAFTGIDGIIADIQYEFDRYQFTHISGWRYGIENIVLLEDEHNAVTKTESEKYLNALREINTHIRSTSEPVEYIIKTLLETLPEYEVNDEDIKDWV